MINFVNTSDWFLKAVLDANVQEKDKKISEPFKESTINHFSTTDEHL